MVRHSRKFEIAKHLAEILDRRFTIPGTSIRIGLDPILGLIPGVGDALAGLAGSVILVVAAQSQLPKIVLIRMSLNIAINSVVGAIPILGDLFSVWFKSNVKNVELLERYAVGDRPRSTTGDWVFVIGLLLVVALVIAGTVVGILWLLMRIWEILQGMQ
ncbi:DUF4112 domain-containing protein [Candidatus Nitrospira neomarina]|uniref:DUF4112 domain-containing protein n=1 Tax=Candidatus Nitrospira neomarina TaxID=3020899 RepID=A0AA96GNK5_9BACT|nr:DUF4112 domain-containing protein [Candidatus Nitrospira neomarina]WNM62463.1 DUF4112 domain-containing protein [Candidatus Nitrospira neomarina]